MPVLAVVADAIVLRGMIKRFGKTRAVDDLSLTVPHGRLLGLVGPNGAGKTTALRCACGLLRMDAGRAWLDGHDIMEDPIPGRRALAYIPEVPHPFPYLTATEHLTFVARAYGLPDGWGARADRLLADLDLDEKADSLAMELSKGQKQKIHLAMAMVRAPTVLVLDEPLIGIDPKGAHILKEWIRERMRAGAGGIVSSHSLPLVEAVCDRVAIMDHGRILVEGTIDELREHARAERGTSFEDVFLKITEGTDHRPAR